MLYECDNYAVTLHREMGEKGSNFLRRVICQTVKNQLGITPQFDVLKNSVVTRFVAPRASRVVTFLLN